MYKRQVVALCVFVNWQTAVAFVIGAVMSGLAGLVGMKLATYANVRVSNTARLTKKLGATLKVAFRGGSVMGLCVGGFALLGIFLVYVIFGLALGQDVYKRQLHSIAQTIGGFFPISHGLIDAILLPYVIDYNSADPTAKAVYDSVAKDMGGTNMADIVRELNKKLGIPARVKDAIPDEAAFMANLDEMAKVSLADGCTKTNPIIPTVPQFAELIKKAYLG